MVERPRAPAEGCWSSAQPTAQVPRRNGSLEPARGRAGIAESDSGGGNRHGRGQRAFTINGVTYGAIGRSGRTGRRAQASCSALQFGEELGQAKQPESASPANHLRRENGRHQRMAIWDRPGGTLHDLHASVADAVADAVHPDHRVRAITVSGAGETGDGKGARFAEPLPGGGRWASERAGAGSRDDFRR